MGALHLVPLTVITVAGGVALALSLGSACAPAQGRATPSKEIIVEAGSRARLDSVVSFDASGIAPGIYDLRAEAGGAPVPLRVDRDGRGWFILPQLAAGAQRRFRLSGTRATSGGIRAGRSGDSVSFTWDKQPLPRRHNSGASRFAPARPTLPAIASSSPMAVPMPPSSIASGTTTPIPRA